MLNDGFEILINNLYSEIVQINCFNTSITEKVINYVVYGVLFFFRI